MDTQKRMNLKPVVYVGISALVFMLILSVYGWIQVGPEQKIPVHWGIDGQPDRYGSKFEGLLSIPLVSVFLLALFLVIPWLEPRRLNLEQSQTAYKAIAIGLFLFMTILHGVLVLSALGHRFQMNKIVFTGVGFLFVIIGISIRKIHSNFFMGIRTPWTLSSELSWQKTHQLGGILFTVLGIVILILPWFTGGSFLIYVLITGIAVVALVPVIYSYVIWKSDPNKQTSGR